MIDIYLLLGLFIFALNIFVIVSSVLAVILWKDRKKYRSTLQTLDQTLDHILESPDQQVINGKVFTPCRRCGRTIIMNQRKFK